MFSKQLYIKYSTCTYVRGNFSVSIKNDVCNTRLTSTSTKQLISSNSGSLSTTQRKTTNDKWSRVVLPSLYACRLSPPRVSPSCARARATLRPRAVAASTKRQRSKVIKPARGLRHPAMKIQLSTLSIRSSCKRISEIFLTEISTNTILWSGLAFRLLVDLKYEFKFSSKQDLFHTQTLPLFTIRALAESRLRVPRCYSTSLAPRRIPFTVLVLFAREWSDLISTHTSGTDHAEFLSHK